MRDDALVEAACYLLSCVIAWLRVVRWQSSYTTAFRTAGLHVTDRDLEGAGAMRSHHHLNGHDEKSGGPAGDSSDSEGSEPEEGTDAGVISWEETGVPARALAALNAMRKNRQFYDVVLVVGGCEVAAHRAVLAALSPYLFEAFTAAAERGPAPPPDHPPLAFRLDGAAAARSPDALRALVEYAYTGRMQLRAELARDLYECAWALRVEEVRERCADHLLQRLTPDSCMAVRALPGLATHHARRLDDYIAHNFRRLCESSALSALPTVRLEVVRPAGAADHEPPSPAVAAAALQWLREVLERDDTNVDELCARMHLLYRSTGGELRDCGDFPAAVGDPPEVAAYRRAAAARRARPTARTPPAMGPARAPLVGYELGSRTAPAEWSVLASERLAPAATLALCNLGGRLVQVSVTSRAQPAPNGASSPPTERGPAAEAEATGAARLAVMERGRCALGLAALGNALVAVGGYDRAEVLRAVECYTPHDNVWSALSDLRTPRARFGVAVLNGKLYAVGGSDGYNELDTVDVFSPSIGLAGGGSWSRGPRLPRGVAQAGVCAMASSGSLVVAGGWAGGVFSRDVYRYSLQDDAWSAAPPLGTARSQCAAVWWRDAVWVLGGCDAWHCLSSTERLPATALTADTNEGADVTWVTGPALPTARRAAGGAVWRERLVVAGGSDGGTSLRRVDWLEGMEGEWRTLPAMRVARAALGLAVLQDVLYAAGGFTGKEFLASVECLLRPDDEWTELRATHPPLLAPQLTAPSQTQEAVEAKTDSPSGKEAQSNECTESQQL
ncbi:Influenza virus NS1A-binding protein homolog [Eumeta japonica]|uniref:Influenza virus NS1A-binding protein homolog n=1 Tax=Eumeta variegata TaxID=151549 RepID=A0A4C1TQZ2_EUMVA|nr:Influenza virus NS1A-binding protein homolog [Eumeta japonica]